MTPLVPLTWQLAQQGEPSSVPSAQQDLGRMEIRAMAIKLHVSCMPKLPSLCMLLKTQLVRSIPNPGSSARGILQSCNFVSSWMAERAEPRTAVRSWPCAGNGCMAWTNCAGKMK